MPDPIMRFFVILCLLAATTASPILRQQTQTPPDVQPDAELLPSGPSPSPGITPSNSPPASPVPTFVPPPLTPLPSPAVSPTAQTSPQPTVSPALASPPASPPPDGSPLPPGVLPGDGDGDGDGDTNGVDTDGDGVPDDFDGDGIPDDEQQPEPTPLFEGGDSNRAALAGGLTGGFFALLLLLLCLYCFVFAGGKREDETGTGVYTSTEAGVGPSAEAETSAEGAPSAPGALDKDTARDAGPAVAAAAGAGAGAAAAAAGADEEGTEAVAPVPRGPTPPPHDYVLGAGPAATRRDFVDLRTKFERDEIGDNSAVLGVERSGVVGEGLETDMSQTAAATGAAGATVAAAAALPRETETAPGVDIKPESLPDRGGPVPMTFESQERLMAGGDGSGAISDAAMSLNAASIVEESGDVPSLERDPIIRDRDETF